MNEYIFTQILLAILIIILISFIIMYEYRTVEEIDNFYNSLNVNDRLRFEKKPFSSSPWNNSLIRDATVIEKKDKMIKIKYDVFDNERIEYISFNYHNIENIKLWSKIKD